jgi:hypothetical protein
MGRQLLTHARSRPWRCAASRSCRTCGVPAPGPTSRRSPQFNQLLEAAPQDGVGNRSREDVLRELVKRNKGSRDKISEDIDRWFSGEPRGSAEPAGSSH